jgi:hypothetical protein
VTFVVVGLTLRATTCPPALRQRLVPPVIAKVLMGWSKEKPWTVTSPPGGCAVITHSNAAGGAGSDGGAHDAAEADLAAVAVQVLAAHEHVTERGRPGGRDVDEGGFDRSADEVQHRDVVGLGGGERGKLSVVASRAVRKMSVFQRRGMAISPWWWGSIVPVAGREGGARAACAMSAPNCSNKTNWYPATASAYRPVELRSPPMKTRQLPCAPTFNFSLSHDPVASARHSGEQTNVEFWL